MWTKDDVVEMLKKEQGERSLRTYAKEIGCSATYLSKTYRGERPPGPMLLDRFGLEEKKVTTVTYVKRRWR